MLKYDDEYRTVLSFHYLNSMGYANKDTYLELMEEARWHLYNCYGYTKSMITEQHRDPVVLETHFEYENEILVDEMVTIKTTCIESSGSSGQMKQVVYKENGSKSCQVDLVLGMFDPSEKKEMHPNGFWRDVRSQMENRRNELNEKRVN